MEKKFSCKHCSMPYFSKKIMQAHEDICVKNIDKQKIDGRK
jgi:hypothetical protein